MTSGPQKAAFTLIELLVVVGIIVIGTSLLFIGGTGGSDGVKLSSAQRIVSSMAQGVRQQALLKSQRARLIIYSESNADGMDKWLRFFGTIYEDPENDNQWIASTQGTYLPQGIYLDHTLSEQISAGLSSLPKMNLEYPRQTAQSETGDTYYYYEFNPNGTLATDFINSWLVLRAGTLKPDDAGVMSVQFNEEEKANLKSALIFRRVGSTTLVTDPSEISTQGD